VRWGRTVAIIAVAFVALASGSTRASAATTAVRDAGRCASVTPSSTLNLVCGPLSEIIAANHIWTVGTARLAKKYGYDLSRVSFAGGLPWRRVAQQAGHQLEVGAEICSPKRKALRARLALRDRRVLTILCPSLTDDLTFLEIEFTLASDRRKANVSEQRALDTINADLHHNQPLLVTALEAADL
jgi:hypothetical protein